MRILIGLALVSTLNCRCLYAATFLEFAAVVSSVKLDLGKAEADVEISQWFDEFGGIFREDPGSLHVVDKANYMLLSRQEIAAGDHVLADCRGREVRQGKGFFDQCLLKKLGALKGHLESWTLSLPQNPAPSEFTLAEKPVDAHGKTSPIVYLAHLVGNASNDSFSDYKRGDELLCEVHDAVFENGKVKCNVFRNASLEERRETERRESIAKQERDRQARLEDERKRQEELEADKAKREAARRKRVAAWRALRTKPPLPQSARRFKVLAEDAVHEKHFEDAANFYAKALEIEPLWPQGQFNLAVLYGEMKQYGDAITHMQRYLELEPNAADAQAAGDKIILWEEKAKNGTR